LQRVFSTVTLLGLLVATAAAFAITEHLKLEKSPVSIGQITKVFSPVCKCPTRKAVIRLKLRQEGRVTVSIVDAPTHGNTVATIARDVLVGAHSPQHFPWHGQTDAGGRAPDGAYYASVELPHRTFTLINKIVLDTKPPKVLSATGLKRKPVLLAGPGRSVAIRYAFSEKAHALVYLHGRQIILGRQTEGSKIKWNGRANHRAVPAGRYVLSIGAQDLAGNETPAAGRKDVTVVVRYVELSPKLVAVGSGGRIRVHVTTAARRYRWRLGQRHGERRGRVLRLHAPTTPGTYRLVVGEPGRSATTVVRVHP
jgi:hypothetical protein